MKITKISGIGDAIINSIQDRKTINISFENIKINLRDIASINKMLTTDILREQINESKAYNRISVLVNDVVNELSNIEPIVKIYYELYMNEFTQYKTAIEKVCRKLPLIKQNGQLI